MLVLNQIPMVIHLVLERISDSHPNLNPMNKMPVVTAITAYDDPLTGTTAMLIFNQALWFGNSMNYSLLSNN